MRAPLVPEDQACAGTGASLLHRTAVSGLRLGAAMQHHLDAPPSVQVASESFPDLGRVTGTATLEPGPRLRLVKFVAYGWSAVRSQPAIAAQVAAARMDLDYREHNTREDLHLASLAGTRIALVSGLAGLRERAGSVAFRCGAHPSAVDENNHNSVDNMHD